jgi:hypothetical protein
MPFVFLWDLNSNESEYRKTWVTILSLKLSKFESLI